MECNISTQYSFLIFRGSCFQMNNKVPFNIRQFFKFKQNIAPSLDPLLTALQVTQYKDRISNAELKKRYSEVPYSSRQAFSCAAASKK